mmetsp:Transcript_3924/g.5176  ORF Transcript_3924/g.5176 Transcript_3924/m.5176 type:complete len:95 (+) Transcript_3924:156-440(+)
MPVLETCDHCGKDFTKIEYCVHCKKAQYCGRSCKLAAWKSGHKAVCEGLKDFREGKNDIEDFGFNMTNWIMIIGVMILAIVLSLFYFHGEEIDY